MWCFTSWTVIVDTAVAKHEKSDVLKQKLGSNVVEYCSSYIVFKEFFFKHVE